MWTKSCWLQDEEFLGDWCRCMDYSVETCMQTGNCKLLRSNTVHVQNWFCQVTMWFVHVDCGHVVDWSGRFFLGLIASNSPCFRFPTEHCPLEVGPRSRWHLPEMDQRHSESLVDSVSHKNALIVLGNWINPVGGPENGFRLQGWCYFSGLLQWSLSIKASGGMPRDWAAAGITHINLGMEAQQSPQEPMKLTSHGVQVTPGYSQVAVCR